MEKKGSRLSPIPYLKHNKRRTSALVISLAAFGLLCYVLSYFMATFYEPEFEHVLGLYKKMSLISIGIDVGEYETTEQWDQLAKEECNKVCEDVKAITGNDDVFVVRRRYFNLKLPAGQASNQMVFFDNGEDMDKYFDLIGAKLISGRMPETTGELLVDKNTYMNRGDGLLSDLSSEYKIVGQVECDYYVAFGYAAKAENNYCFLYFNKSANEDITGKLTDNGYEVNGYINEASVEENLQDEKQVFSNIRFVFSVVSITLLSICMLVVLSLHIRDRHEEWCLYNSIGFSVGDVYLMALKELLISFGAGLLFSAILSAATVASFDLFMLSPLGLETNTFRPDDILRVFIYFFVIFAFCQIPLFLQLRTITTVDDIE